MTERGKLTYDENDTFSTLYDQLNNKYLNPIVTSNLILAKALRDAAELLKPKERFAHISETAFYSSTVDFDEAGKVIHANFGGDDDDAS